MSSSEWQIRRSGMILARSPVPYLGYPPHVLRDMARNGLQLYCNGKKVKGENYEKV